MLTADLAEPGGRAALGALVADRTIDVLVNNAGVGDYGEFHLADPAKLTQMVQLNVSTLTDLTRGLLLPTMIERSSGRVLNVASTAAFMPGPLMSVYYATKAYVLSLGEALADEVRGTGVTVTTVCPGPIATGFQASGADMVGAPSFVRGKQLMSAETCATAAVKAMERGKRIVIPGVMNRLTAATPLVSLPPPLRRAGHRSSRPGPALTRRAGALSFVRSVGCQAGGGTAWSLTQLPWNPYGTRWGRGKLGDVAAVEVAGRRARRARRARWWHRGPG